jgi:hypothetical protein
LVDGKVNIVGAKASGHWQYGYDKKSDILKCKNLFVVINY